MAVEANSKFSQSLSLYAQAADLFPYGTQLLSRRPERAAFGQAPIYYDRAKDAHFWDIDGNEFVDTDMGVGPVVLGYCYGPVDKAVTDQIAKGVLGSVNHPLEVEMAQMIVDMVPCADMVKFCKGGGDADAIAVRIARAYTGKDVVLFCGYHGWHDWYLAANLKSNSTLNGHLLPGIVPKGVPAALADTTLPFEYNNLDSLSNLLNQNRDRVACIIMEPTRSKHPDKGFLEGVRQLADEHQCLLIFDEVITGFRMAPGGAQEYYGVVPDLATFAKAIANGYPLAAVAGKKQIMAAQSDNFISSTYYSDTVSLAAGVATLKEIKQKPVIETITARGQKLSADLLAAAQKHGVKATFPGHGYLFCMEFDYGDLSNKLSSLFMQEMIARGVYANGAFYMCFTHTDEDMARIVAAADETFAVIARAIDSNDIDNVLRCPPRQMGFGRLV